MTAMESLLRDLAAGTRRLRRDRLLTVTAILSLAIGIGANTGIYTVANAMLRRPQPGIAEPARVLDIGRTHDGYGFNPVSYPDYRDVKSRTTRLQQVYAYTMFPQAMTLTPGRGGAPGRVYATTVSTTYFAALGARPLSGRLFHPDEGEGNAANAVIVISDDTWTRAFARRSDIAGLAVTLNDRPFTVVGVAPAAFHGTGLRHADAWIPIGAIRSADTPTLLAAPDSAWLMIGGRLNAGESLQSVNAELAVIDATLPSSRGELNRGLRATTLSPVAGGAGPVGAFLLVLVVIVGAVLAVACTNVAGMLLSRAPVRRREMAVRAAMGATRRRLTRQLLTETVVLFGAGAAAGLAVAWALTRAIVVVLPALPFPVDLSLRVDGQAVLFTSGLTFVAALLSGLLPAIRASRSDLVAAMRSDAGPTGGMRLRRAFVISQVAASVTLVIVGGLFLRALQTSGVLDPRFDASGVDLVTVDLASERSSADSSGPTLDAVLERVRTVPNVSLASAALSFPGGFEEFRLGAIEPVGMGDPLTGDWNVVLPGYFATIRMPLVAGRDFTTTDRVGSQPVVILGEGVMRRQWPGRRPQEVIGSTVRLHRLMPGGRADSISLAVIGIARDPAYGTLVDGATDFHAYVPFAQQPVPRIMLVARTRDGGSAINEIRAAVAAVNPGLVIAAAQSAEEYSTLGLLPQRIGAAVTAGLGLVGVLLAAVGIFGVTAHAVIRRSREIGIRLALGAPLPSIARLVLGEGMSLVALGALAGVGLGSGAAQLVSGYLAGLPPLDPLAFGAAVLLFIVTGFLACAVPVRRALRIAPGDCLRED